MLHASLQKIEAPQCTHGMMHESKAVAWMKVESVTSVGSGPRVCWEQGGARVRNRAGVSQERRGGESGTGPMCTARPGVELGKAAPQNWVSE